MAEWADEKARDVVRKYYGQLGAMEDEVAQALREAEARGMERAAEICDAQETLCQAECDRAGAELCFMVATDIREAAGTVCKGDSDVR